MTKEVTKADKLDLGSQKGEKQGAQKKSLWIKHRRTTLQRDQRRKWKESRRGSAEKGTLRKGEEKTWKNGPGRVRNRKRSKVKERGREER